MTDSPVCGTIKYKVCYQVFVCQHVIPTYFKSARSNISLIGINDLIKRVTQAPTVSTDHEMSDPFILLLKCCTYILFIL